MIYANYKLLVRHKKVLLREKKPACIDIENCLLIRGRHLGFVPSHLKFENGSTSNVI
jgi:hypothetical protein